MITILIFKRVIISLKLYDRNPPQIIPFPIFEAELSDPDLSPNKEKTSTNAATKVNNKLPPDIHTAWMDKTYYYHKN